jgi:hypothetical protein
MQMFGSRIGRRCLVRPAWLHSHGCTVPGCLIPLNAPDADLDEDECDIRDDELAHRGLSFTQVCFKCRGVYCRYHLSKPINLADRFSYDFQQDEWEPPIARLCSKCLLEYQVNFILWSNHLLEK